jgi:hypothetical protein
MMLAEPFEHLSRRHVRAGIGESLCHALTEPIVEGRFLAIEGAHRGAHDLARRRIGTGLDPRRDALLKVA